MKDFPVTIRLLDPPLHEFLPHTDEEIEEIAKYTKKDLDKLKDDINNLKEANPMLGHRGCRLAITYPEIYEIQVKAIIEAAIKVKKELAIDIQPEIMIPFIISEQEIKILVQLVRDIANNIIENSDTKIKYLVGTMIELPRASLNADKLAKHVDFFSFGTNDLTQTTLGISRDDSGRFLEDYINNGIFEKDPFMQIDVNGVGQLVEIAVNKAKKVNPNIKLGICGEHGGDPKSIDFFYKLGLNYVSCSPFRVPIARLALAQSVIKN